MKGDKYFVVPSVIKGNNVTIFKIKRRTKIAERK
jgi:hypothetical protein